MSYQIKSTPFFRRMVSTSKRNGQLQKLKDEYERSKDLNERTIEMKMRQVRLKRLFKEIEEIKETSTPIWKRRRLYEKPKTTEELRMETFVRAKELGKEYSKLNALQVERYGVKQDAQFGGFPGQGYPIASTPSKSYGDRKARCVKRLVYGNAISRSNIIKIAQTSKKRERPRDQDEPTDSAKQMIKLKQRINYGNTRSSMNMCKIPKRNGKSQLSSDAYESLETDLVEPSTFFDIVRDNPEREVDYIDAEPTVAALAVASASPPAPVAFAAAAPAAHAKPPEQQQVEHRHERHCPQPQSDEHKSTKGAAKVWHKVSHAVRRFDLERRRTDKSPAGLEKEQKETTEMEESDQEPIENKLRSISNDTHLPLSQLSMKTAISTEFLDEPMSEDVLVKIENLDQVSSEDLMASDIPRNFVSQKVKNFVKMFEPCGRPTVRKDAFDSGEQKICGIFESQGE